MALPAYASTGQRVWHYAFRILCGLIFFYLIAPILVIIPLSFNAQDFFTFTPEMLRLDPRGISTSITRTSSPTSTGRFRSGTRSRSRRSRR
jgi:hypothetical protein